MKPFYLDESLLIRFPKRAVYDTLSHEIWFRDEGIPILGTIRGYFYEDHVLVYVNDFDIPPLHPAVIMDWFNTYSSLKYVELGLNRVNNEQIAKMVLFRGDGVKFNPLEEEEDISNDLIEEATKKVDKPMGFVTTNNINDEDNSTE